MNNKKTLVKRGASITATTTAVCGVTLGYYRFIGAGAVFTKDIRDYASVYGNLGRNYGWMCQCGTRLSFADATDTTTATCRQCGSRYQKNAFLFTLETNIDKIPKGSTL